jgi:hypothetical protein
LLWATAADEPSYDYAAKHELCSGEEMLINLSMTNRMSAAPIARKLTEAGAAVTNPVHIQNFFKTPTECGKWGIYLNSRVVGVIVSNPLTPIDMKIGRKPLIQAFALDSEEMVEHVCVELARRGQDPNSGDGVTCVTECKRKGWHEYLSDIEAADADRLAKLEKLTHAMAQFLALHWKDAKELSEIRLAADALGWRI